MEYSLIEEAIKIGFRCDPVESLAIAILRTIQTTEGEVYNFDVSVKIRPYPNPLKYGGYWQDLTTDKPDERDSHLAFIKNEFEQFKQIGMVKVDILKGTPATQITQLRMGLTEAIPSANITAKGGKHGKRKN